MSSSHHHTLGRALLAVGAAVIALTPTSAEAQFLKKIKKAAQDAVVDAAVGKPAPASGSQADAESAPDGSPKSGAIEITEATIDTFLVAMRPMLAEAERKRAAMVAERMRDVYNKCIETTTSNLTIAPTPEGMEESGKYLDLLMPVHQAYAAALQAGEKRRAAMLEDSVATLTDLQMKAMYPALRKCGERPRTPFGGSDESTESAVPTRPAGMTATSFGRLRERIALYLLTDGKQGPASDAERAALASRQAQLAPLTELFRDGSLEWGNWGDVARGWETGSN